MSGTIQSSPKAIGFECLAATLSALVVSAIGSSKCDAPLELWELLIGLAALPVSVWAFLRCPKRPLTLKATLAALLALSALVAALAASKYWGHDLL